MWIVLLCLLAYFLFVYIITDTSSVSPQGAMCEPWRFQSTVCANTFDDAIDALVQHVPHFACVDTPPWDGEVYREGPLTNALFQQASFQTVWKRCLQNRRDLYVFSNGEPCYLLHDSKGGRMYSHQAGYAALPYAVLVRAFASHGAECLPDTSIDGSVCESCQHHPNNYDTLNEAIIRSQPMFTDDHPRLYDSIVALDTLSVETLKSQRFREAWKRFWFDPTRHTLLLDSKTPSYVLRTMDGSLSYVHRETGARYGIVIKQDVQKALCDMGIPCYS